MKLIYILLISLFLTSFASAQDKYAIVYFGATWCGPCQKMHREVWGTQEVEKFVTKDLVPSADIQIYDIDVDQNKTYAAQWNVTSLPTTIVMKINDKGPTFPSIEVARKVGFQPMRDLINFLKNSVK